MGQLQHFFAGRYAPPRPDPLIQAMRYDPDASDRWRNTLIAVMPVNAQLEAGIGVVTVFLEDMTGEIDLPARYLLLEHPTDSRRYAPLAADQNRFLYRRLDP
jgi:hypothetical protein